MRPWLWPVVQRVIGRDVPADRLAPVLGDLLEDYEAILAARGRVRAEWWLLGETASLASSYRRHRRIGRTGVTGVVDRLAWDGRQAWRSVRARPAATIATITVLALGIGLVSAMFALADPYTLRPLPYAGAGDLHVLSLVLRSPREIPRVSDWQARSEVFAGLAAARPEKPLSVTGSNGDALALNLSSVSSNYFDVLGMPTVVSAEWRPAGAAGEAPVVLTATASRRLLGTTRAHGQILATDDRARPRLRVAAVLPSSYIDPLRRSADAFVPLGDEPVAMIVRTVGGGSDAEHLGLVARAQSGVSAEAIGAALSTAPREPQRAVGATGIAVTATPLATRLTARVRPVALGALAAGLLILVVSAANVSNLLLARGAARVRELAAREALGATRRDIVRLVLAELVLVTAVGVGAGLGCAALTLTVVGLVIPAEYVSLGVPAISLRVAWFAAGTGFVIMIAGLIPAWAAWRVAPTELFSRTSTLEGRFVRAFRFAMLSAQTAVAVVLLVGAALLGRSFVNLVTQDPGYEGATFALRVIYAASARGQLSEDVDSTIERLQRLPGVTRAAVATGVLVDGGTMVGAGAALTINGQRVSSGQRQVSNGFYEAAGVRLVAGRLPSAAEHERSMVVSESFAERCCDGRSPMGLVATTAGKSFEIVGVVKNIFTSALDQRPGPVAFVPLDDEVLPIMNYVAKVDRVDHGLALAMEREVRAVGPTASIASGATMRERLMRSVNDRSFATLLVVFFAVAAIGVSAAGLAGVVGFVVARRTREIAIRMAIGADAAQIRWLVTRQALVAAAVGTALGFAGSAWLSRTLEAWLYGIMPADPISFVAAGVLVLTVVLIAAWLPARRAVRLSPTVALRLE